MSGRRTDGPTDCPETNTLAADLPRLPEAERGRVLAALGRAVLGPEGARVAYRPEVARWLAHAGP